MDPLKQFKPTKHLLVYDLVREAGLNVTDWSNYKKSQSA